MGVVDNEKRDFKRLQGARSGDAGLKQDGRLIIDQGQIISLGIDSADARRLRNELLQKNIEYKQKKGHEYSQVLVPHHAFRIYRHKKTYDENTSFFVKEEAFEVKPYGGYRDILGIKFKYTYDKPVTDFSIIFNNFRGRNRHTFMSGDVVEFYFELIDEETLKKIEKFDGYNVASYRTGPMPPLVFCGRLESLASSNLSDGITLEWKGRNGGYILDDQEISVHYPVNLEGTSASASQLYEEIIWEIVTEKTGMIVGEVDLGQKPDKYISGQGIIDPSGFCSNLMGYANPQKDAPERSFGADLRQEIQKIMVRHPFCRVSKQQGSSSNDKFGLSTPADVRREKNTNTGTDSDCYAPRWSALLEYDLMRPRIFGTRTIKMEPTVNAANSSGGSGTGGSGTGASGGSLNGIAKQQTGDYHFQSAMCPGMLFKTEWAQQIYDLLYARKAIGVSKISAFAKIKTIFGSTEKKYIMVKVDDYAHRPPDDPKVGFPCYHGGTILTRIYNELYASGTGLKRITRTNESMPVLQKWRETVIKAYEEVGGNATDSSQKDAQGGAALNLVANVVNRDINAHPVKRTLQNPNTNYFSAGAYLRIPAPGSSEDGPSAVKLSVMNWKNAPAGSLPSGLEMPEDARYIYSYDTKPDADTPSKLVLYARPAIGVSTEYAYNKKNRNTAQIIITKMPDSVVSGSSKTHNTSTTTENIKLTVMVSGPDIVRAVTGKMGSASAKVVEMNDIPNRIDIISQVLSRLGFNTFFTQEAMLDLQQPAVPGTYTLGYDDKMPYDSTPGDMSFENKGSVASCIDKATAKFPSCVVYVDEFNILHVRPRYKFLQSEEWRNDDPCIPPIWGLYSGHPIYPRLFKVSLSDAMKLQPNSIVMIGESANNTTIFSKVDHRLLQAVYGIKQVVIKGDESFNSHYEAKAIAQNKMLEWIRNGLTVSVECDLIPELRPGHRINIVDFITGAMGEFLIENISWEYSKESGIKMSLGLSSVSLQANDAFTSMAVFADKQGVNLGGDYLQSIQEQGRMGSGGYFEFLSRSHNIDAGKAENKEALERQQNAFEEWVDKAMPEFNLEREKGVVTFERRDGFETQKGDSSKYGITPDNKK